MMTKIFGLALVIGVMSSPANAAVDDFLDFDHHGTQHQSMDRPCQHLKLILRRR
jgi:hypothetical protein